MAKPKSTIYPNKILLKENTKMLGIHQQSRVNHMFPITEINIGTLGIL